MTEWGIIVLLFAVGYALDFILVWACVVVLLGSRQHALGVLAHDGAHRAAAKNRFVNDLATQVFCFWPLGVGIGGFRRFHFQHHRHFNTNLDPELQFKNHGGETLWKLPTTKVQIIGYFLLDLVGFGVPEVVKAFRLLGRVGWWDWAGPVLWWAIVGTFLYVTGLWFVAVVWVAGWDLILGFLSAANLDGGTLARAPRIVWCATGGSGYSLRRTEPGPITSITLIPPCHSGDARRCARTEPRPSLSVSFSIPSERRLKQRQENCLNHVAFEHLLSLVMQNGREIQSLPSTKNSSA